MMCTPILSRIVSLFAEHNELESAPLSSHTPRSSQTPNPEP